MSYFRPFQWVRGALQHRRNPRAEYFVLLFFFGCSSRPFQPFPEHPSWSAVGEDSKARFGYRACSAGDINGDGYSDLIIGSPGYDHSRGKVYVYLGGPEGLSSKPAWTFEGEHRGDAFGDRVGAAGDVNGDGFGDIYITASSWKNGVGKIYVFYGGPHGLGSQPSWTAHGVGKPPLSFGDCTVPVGDLNGDGYDDLAVGAYGYAGTRGEVFVFYGSSKGLGSTAGWKAVGEAPGDQFGYGMGPAGDINGDGDDDLMIASKYHTERLPQEGKAYLYLGSSHGLASPAWTKRGDSRAANLGTRVYGAGRLDRLLSSVLISEPYADSGTGKVLIFDGTAQGLSGQAAFTLLPEVGETGYGFCLGPLGHCGARQEPGFFVSSSAPSGGRVDIYEMIPGRGPLRVEALQGLQAKDDRYGQWCAPAGDLNGDGAADLCISADADGPGRVDVYYGNPAPNGKRNPDAALGYFVGMAKYVGIAKKSDAAKAD